MKDIRASIKNKMLSVGIIVVTIIIISALNASKPEPKKKINTEKSWSVNFEEISFQRVHPQIELLGSVESPFDSNLTSAIIAYVKSVPVREGDAVDKGLVLVELEDTDTQIVLKQRQADVAELEAQIRAENNRYQSDQKALTSEQYLLELSKNSLARQKKLMKSNLVSQEKNDSAQFELTRQILTLNARELNIANHDSRLAQLKARLSRTKTTLSDAKLDLDRTQIRAPFSGRITEVNVSPGDRVFEGQTIARIYDQDKLEIRAQIPDRIAGKIKNALANQLQITASATIYGEEVELRLDRLSGKANFGSGGVDALFTVTQGKSLLIIGNSIKLVLNLPALDDVVTAPLSSIFGTNRLYLIENERLQPKTVDVLGHYFNSNGKHRVIVQNNELAQGDRIITTQLPSAISGLKVKPRGQ